MGQLDAKNDFFYKKNHYIILDGFCFKALAKHKRKKWWINRTAKLQCRACKEAIHRYFVHYGKNCLNIKIENENIKKKHHQPT